MNGLEPMNEDLRVNESRQVGEVRLVRFVEIRLAANRVRRVWSVAEIADFVIACKTRKPFLI